jgi:hypothetical protein
MLKNNFPSSLLILGYFQQRWEEFLHSSIISATLKINSKMFKKIIA